jgi:teichuronic acid exporter
VALGQKRLIRITNYVLDSFIVDLRLRVLSALRWTASAKLLGQLLSWSMTIIVIRLLTPTDYGLMAIAMVFIAFLSIVDDLGLAAALIQRKELNTLLIRQIFTLLLLVNVLFLILLFTAAPVIAAFYETPRLIPMIQVLSLRFLLVPFTMIPEALLERELDLKRRSINDFAAALTGAVTTLTLAYADWQVWALVWGQIATSLSRTIGLIVISPFHEFRPTTSLSGMRSSIIFGSQVGIERLLWFFYSRSDVMIASKLLGKDLLGTYNVAMHLASLPMQKISGLINQVALPAFSRIQLSPDKVASYFLKVVRIMSFLAFPTMWGISCISEELVVLLLGEAWQPAALPLQILSLVIPIRMLNNLLPSVLQGLGRADLAVSNLLIASIIMPLAFLIGCRWGLLGISLVWSVAFPIVFLIVLWRTLPILGISVRDFIQALARPLLASVGMYIIATSAKHFLSAELNVFFVLLVMILTGAGAYLFLIWKIHRDGWQEMLGLVRH